MGNGEWGMGSGEWGYLEITSNVSEGFPSTRASQEALEFAI